MTDEDVRWDRNLPLRAALDMAGRRWRCFCGCSLTCEACLRLLESFILGRTTVADYYGHRYLHGPSALPPLTVDDGRGAERAFPIFADDAGPPDVVNLCGRPMGYRLARAAGMTRDDDP